MKKTFLNKISPPPQKKFSPKEYFYFLKKYFFYFENLPPPKKIFFHPKNFFFWKLLSKQFTKTKLVSRTKFKKKGVFMLFLTKIV